MSITTCDEMEMICVGCEGIFSSEIQETCKAMMDFVLNENHSSRSHNEIYILSADGAVDQHIVTNTVNLPHAHFMADQ